MKNVAFWSAFCLLFEDVHVNFAFVFVILWRFSQKSWMAFNLPLFTLLWITVDEPYRKSDSVNVSNIPLRALVGNNSA
ncbi:unnamed protein product [Hymenolepis diminuta]|uniref:Uncharacterized protein n=1 Tax=Hymenolepis diminuta TaxID=6216 RepID=A0A564Z5E2_HYMDI|nr:unnamed protein product [Hymenolepis diminuta]